MTARRKALATGIIIGTLATAGTLTAGTLAASADTPAPTPTTDSTPSTQPAQPEQWTASIDGKNTTLTQNADGTLTLETASTSAPPDSILITGSDGAQRSINRTSLQDTPDHTTVGVTRHTATAEYTADKDTGNGNPAVGITLRCAWTEGTETTATGTDGQSNRFDTSGRTAVSMGDEAFTADGTPRKDMAVTLSDGTSLPIKWADAPTRTPKAGEGILTAWTGTATGSVTANGHTWPVTVNVTATRTQTWHAEIDGKDTTLTTLADGTQSAAPATINGTPAPQTTATPDKGTPVTITGSMSGTLTDTGTLGQARSAGTAAYKRQADTTTGTPAFDITVPWQATVGDQLTINSGQQAIAFAKGADGTYTAQASATLDTANKPDTNEVTLSDGSTHPIAWDKATQTTTKTVTDNAGNTQDITYVTLTGSTEGDTTVTDPLTGATLTQHWKATVTASRAQDTHFTLLAVKATQPDGTSTSTPITFTPGTADYTITLPHDQQTAGYSLEEEHGVDATVTGADATLETDASRLLSITANGTRYTVHVTFADADIQEDSPAKLTGIYVQADGKHTKGTLIDNWDANRLAYTLTIDEDAPSPYVLPEAGDGVAITPGDIKQTADTATQEWTVTDKASGASRTYTVTVARRHSWKTKVEEFTPTEPKAIDPTAQPDSDADTSLDSWGWVDAEGRYTPVTEDTYEIPQGGAIAYKAKTGQAVSTASRKVKGMTYEYTLTILPTDHSKPVGQATLTVTYITDATHAAELTGITVNGHALDGFQPGRHEYTATVADTTQWTVTPQWDKLSGMTVSTSKTGDTAAITVTSGDGLVKTVYTVHAAKSILPGAGTTGVGGTTLPSTGSTVRGLLAGTLATLTAGVAALMTGRRARRDLASHGND